MTELDPFSSPAQGAARPFDPLRDEPTRGLAPAEAEGNGRGVLVLVVAIAIIIVFAAVVWNAYRNTGGAGRGADLPVILADGPERTLPEDEGGYVVPEQDNVALDQIEPVVPVAPAEPTLAGEAAADAGGAGTSAVLPTVPPVTAAQRTPLSVPSTTASPETAPLAAAPSAPMTPAAVAGPAAVPIVPAPGGPFLVQVAAVTRADAAEAAWLTEVRRMPQLFEGLVRDVLEVDVPNRGVFHRIRADGFATREAALAFCQQFKARGGDCLVVARAS
jgi:hypothetical protein